MIKELKAFLVLVSFLFAIKAQNQPSQLSHIYPQIVEKLVYYKKNTLKVFYGGPIDRGEKGVRWVMPVMFEGDNCKTRAVYEIAFVNCDVHDAVEAEILFIEVSDINIKFKNTLSKDYDLFSSLLKGEYQDGKYVVVRSTDIANTYYPDIFIASASDEKNESDKDEVVSFLAEQFQTSSIYRDFYVGDKTENVSFEDEREIIYSPALVRISFDGDEHSFLVEKRIRKNDIWKAYYIIARAKDSMEVDRCDGRVLIRLDSGCVSGQIYDDQSCDCLDQLHHALYELAKSNNSNGLIIHIPAHDGRGFGTAPKAETEIYKRGGRGRVNSTGALNTVEAAKTLYGVNDVYDIRSFDGVAEILKEMSISRVTLLTDNIKKVHTLERHGIEVFRKKTGTDKTSCLGHIKAKKNDPMYFSK